MAMSYEDLRKFQRMERADARLASFDKGFYKELSLLIKAQREAAQASVGQADGEARVFENTIKIARDLFERREQKIILKALRAAHSVEPVSAEGMTSEEKKGFERLVGALRSNKQEFEKAVLSGVGRVTAEDLRKIQHVQDIPLISPDSENVESVVSSEDLNMALVRILKKVPKFVSKDLREFGPFESNDVVKLPRKEAELLVSQKFVEFV